MNQIAPVAPVSPGTGLALIPTNIREAMDLATMMARGKLVPKELQNSPADCLLVIEQAARWGMSPFAVAQEVSVIQGKLMHSGKIVAAAVQSCGILSGRLRYDYAGEGDDRAVTVTGTLRGETEPRSVTVRLRDARTKNEHWARSPDQMLAYHGARVWARRYAPEVMLGVYSPEEFDAAPAPPAEPIPPARGPVVDHAPAADEPQPPRPKTLREKVSEIHARLDAVSDSKSLLAVVDDPEVRKLRDYLRQAEPGTERKAASVQLEERFSAAWATFMPPGGEDTPADAAQEPA